MTQPIWDASHLDRFVSAKGWRESSPISFCPDAGTWISAFKPVYDDVRRPDSEQLYRRISGTVESVRDLFLNPLSPEAVIKSPYRHLSRYRLKVRDEASGKLERLYWQASEFESQFWLAVGLFEPGKEGPTKVLGQPFESDADDRAELRRSLKLWTRHDLVDSRLGVFAFDPSLVEHACQIRLRAMQGDSGPGGSQDASQEAKADRPNKASEVTA